MGRTDTHHFYPRSRVPQEYRGKGGLDDSWNKKDNTRVEAHKAVNTLFRDLFPHEMVGLLWRYATKSGAIGANFFTRIGRHPDRRMEAWGVLFAESAEARDAFVKMARFWRAKLRNGNKEAAVKNAAQCDLLRSRFPESFGVRHAVGIIRAEWDTDDAGHRQWEALKKRIRADGLEVFPPARE